MTEQAKPTPGEWGIKISPYSKEKYEVVSQGQLIANIARPIGVSREERLANARLISAALDLLEACESALSSMRCPSKQYEMQFSDHPLFQELTKAIAKAKGEQ